MLPQLRPLAGEGRQFVCRIKAGAIKTCLETCAIPEGGPVFYDAPVRSGAPRANQAQRPVRVVGYRVDGKAYWVATNRFDLPAPDIALIYKLRWEIKKFFGWWKQHLNVYPLIARSPYGFMVQVLGGLITYLLLAIYCHNHFQERVSINRVRELRVNIQNEAPILDHYPHRPLPPKKLCPCKNLTGHCWGLGAFWMSRQRPTSPPSLRRRQVSFTIVKNLE